MRTVICERVEHLAMIEGEEPVAAEGTAIVEIKRIGICGTDLHAYKGNQPFFHYPRVLGHELSGIIIRMNGQSKELAVGDQVAVIPYMHCGQCIACRRGHTNCCVQMQVLGVHIDGGMRERIAVPLTHLIPTNHLTLDESAVIEPLSIGEHALRRSGVVRRETVLVIGAGPIGLGVMALGKLRGLNVIAMDINNERLEFCRRWAKADHAINASQQDPCAALEALTGGDYPTVVFDATGNAKSMTNAFSFVSHGGTLVYVGLVKSSISFDDPEFHKKELTLMGSRNAAKEDFLSVQRVLSEGRLDVSPYISHRSTFEAIPSVIPEWLLPQSKVIKGIIEL